MIEPRFSLTDGEEAEVRDYLDDMKHKLPGDKYKELEGFLSCTFDLEEKPFSVAFSVLLNEVLSNIETQDGKQIPQYVIDCFVGYAEDIVNILLHYWEPEECDVSPDILT